MAGAPEARHLAVFCASEEADAIRAAVAALPFQVTLHGDRCDLPLAPAPAASVVTDAVTDPLAICAALAGAGPTVLITRRSDFEFRLAAARAGVDAVLAAPLDQGELAEWMQHLTSDAATARISVLICDDDLLLAEGHAAALRAAGMTVDVVTTAAAAFERLNDGVPDVILMDVRMPDVDGLETARVIRQSRRFLSVPVIFLSGVRDTGVQLQARRYGGDDFITKPVDPDRLVALVRLRAERAQSMKTVMERDGLTGLLNHSRIKERLAHELDRSARTGAEVSLSMIDLDHFKRVNDTWGHPVGDRVIRTLATTLTSGLRRIDLIGRYGGEEFAVIMLDTPPERARAAIEKQLGRFRQIAFDGGGAPFSATFSAGVAGSRGFPGLDQLVAAADRALYEAKRAGRNQACLEVPR